MGQTLSYKTKRFLQWLGVMEDEINKINLESIRNRKFSNIASSRTEFTRQHLLARIHFKQHELPLEARPLTEHDKKFVNYLKEKRGLEYNDYDFYITPRGIGRNKNRILIPYFFNDKIVGWTSRYLDANKPKYLNEHQQDGFLFGTEMQDPEWNFIVVSEGPFDAIAIRGVSVLHNEISEKQVALLRQTGKEVIVVPDQDKSGVELIKHALAAGFSVSIPEWHNDDKDINDAVVRYGRAGTLLSILSAKTNNKIKVQMALNNLVRRKQLDVKADRIHL
jgi:DNA primase